MPRCLFNSSIIAFLATDAKSLLGSFGINYHDDLEITVVNLWLNRLIGDERGDAGRYGHCAMIQHNAKEPLQPSGLLGPVSVETATY